MELPLATHLGKWAAAIAPWRGICIWEMEDGDHISPSFLEENLSSGITTGFLAAVYIF